MLHIYLILNCNILELTKVESMKRVNNYVTTISSSGNTNADSITKKQIIPTKSDSDSNFRKVSLFM